MKIKLLNNVGLPTLKVDMVYDAVETSGYYLVYDDVSDTDCPPSYVDKWKASVVEEVENKNENKVRYVKLNKEAQIDSYINHDTVYIVEQETVWNGRVVYYLKGYTFTMLASLFFEVDYNGNPINVEKNEDEWTTEKKIYVKITNPSYQGYLKLGKVYEVKEEFSNSYSIAVDSTIAFINKNNVQLANEQEYNESLKSQDNDNNDEWDTKDVTVNKDTTEKINLPTEKQPIKKLKVKEGYGIGSLKSGDIVDVISETENAYQIKYESGSLMISKSSLENITVNKYVKLKDKYKNGFANIIPNQIYLVLDEVSNGYTIIDEKNTKITYSKSLFDVCDGEEPNKDLTNDKKNGNNGKKHKKGKSMKVCLKNKMSFHYKGYHNLTGEYDVINEVDNNYFIRGPKGRFMMVEKDYFMPVNNNNATHTKKNNHCVNQNNDNSSSDVWETKIDTIKECSKAPKEFKVYINLLANVKIKELMKIFPSTEWLGYLVGEKGNDYFIVKDLLIPKQTVTSASVDNIDYTVPEGVTIIGVIHSHHHMSIGFSGTDDEWINQNHNLSVLVSHNGMKANVRFKTPCGGYYVLEGKIIANYNIEWNKEAFKKEIADNISEPHVRFNFDDGYSCNYNTPGFRHQINNLPLQLRGQNSGQTGSLLDEIDKDCTNVADNSAYNV